MQLLQRRLVSGANGAACQLSFCVLEDHLKEKIILLSFMKYNKFAPGRHSNFLVGKQWKLLKVDSLDAYQCAALTDPEALYEQ